MFSVPSTLKDSSSSSIPIRPAQYGSVKEAFSTDRLIPILHDVGLHADLICSDAEEEV